MTAPAVVATGQRTGPPNANGRRGNSQVVATVPFIRASGEHIEPAGIDVSRVMTGSVQDFGVFDIPAYGFLRSLTFVVTATGGVGAGVTAAEDGPWNVLSNIALTEPNGAQIQAFNSGYDMFLSQKWGGYGYVGGSDPRTLPPYSPVAAGSGNFSFILRMNVEMSLRDGLGSLPNQNAAATFKLRMQLNASTAVYGVVPGTTLPTVRVRVTQYAWDQPNPADGQNANQTSPPAINTTQFWSTQVYNMNAGAQTLRLTRVGNYLRNLILVFRRAGTSRANGQADFPDPLTILLDARPVATVERNNFATIMSERTGYGTAVGTVFPAYDAPEGLDNGVFVWDYMHEFNGALGMENRDLWQPTLGSSRFEIQGTFANAGTLTVLTNDVAIAGNVFI
jgi:hypothetical protein